MQTQITCPRCQTRFTTDVFQIVDAQQQPELKQMLLMGALNVAVCPNCNFSSQLAMPLLFHDAEHEMLIVHVPMELNLPLPEQERIVGQLTKAIADSAPPGEFKAYMLQPEMIMTMKTFMERVYETEGITPEMLDRQRKQMELLQNLAAADKETSLKLIEENEALIDETFFAILQSTMQSAQQSPQADQQMIALGNLQARLYTKTETGRRLEKRQVQLRKFQQEVQAKGGLTYELFAEYLMKHKEDEGMVNALLRMGQQAISYELLTIISAKIDEETAAGNDQEVTALSELRQTILEILGEMQEASQKLMDRAKNTLDKMLAEPDTAQAVQKYMREIDEPLMYYLSAEIAAAEQKKDFSRSLALKNIQNHIIQEAERQLPPELQLLNQLVSAEDEATQQQIINSIPEEARPQLVEMLQGMVQAAGNTNDENAAEQINKVLALLQ